MRGHALPRIGPISALLLGVSLWMIVPSLRTAPLADELTADRVLALMRSQSNWEEEDADVTFLMVEKNKEQAKWAARRLRKNYRKTDEVSMKILLVFLHPKNNYKETYLSWRYDDITRTNIDWIYSYDIRRVIRLNYQEDERFLTRYRLLYGTDFTFGDLVERNLKRDDHRVLREEILNYKECFVIESIPRKDISINQGDPYGKRISWIWKDNWLLLKMEHYDRKGKLLKTLHNHWKKIQGFWTLTQSLMKDPQRDHMTIIATKDVRYNTKIVDSFFLPSNLQEAAEFYTTREKGGADEAPH